MVCVTISLMKDRLKELPRQLLYQPTVIHEDRLRPAKRFIVCGLGGSHLAASLLQSAAPGLDLFIHRDYGLPLLPEEHWRDSLIILSSYSGNTAEVLAGAEQALRLGLNAVMVTQGGSLFRFAETHHLPYVKLPDSDLPPRLGLGWSLKAVLKLLGAAEIGKAAEAAAPVLENWSGEELGRGVAETLNGRLPLIYASAKNWAIAYAWKIILNETAKIPAFYNVLPEANHNELAGFDPRGASGALLGQFAALLLPDPADDPRIGRRFDLLKEIYSELGLTVRSLPFSSDTNPWVKIFQSLLLADWTAYHLAVGQGLDPWPVPVIEDFKLRL